MQKSLNPSLIAGIAAAACLTLAPTSALAQVDAIITADNAYMIGQGDASGVTTLFPGVSNCLAGEIFNCADGPETYTALPITLGGYIYLIGYSDEAITQGIIGELTNIPYGGTQVVATGASQPWEVYATGVDFDPACGGNPQPTLADINAAIAVANAAAGDPLTTSVGWIGTTPDPLWGPGALAFGEFNDSNAGSFQIVCNAIMSPTNQWMWFNPDTTAITNPFRTGALPDAPAAMSKEMYIFRIGPLNQLFTECMEVEPGEILCAPDDSGEVTYTFTITNNSGVDAEYLQIPNVNVAPNIIPLGGLSGAGGQATVTITIANAVPGEPFCFDMILADAAFEACCPLHDHCIDIPECDCGQIHDEMIECTGVANEFLYSFTLDNLFPGPIHHAFLIMPSGVTATDDYFDLVALGGPVPQYGSINLSTVISGAAPGDEICFLVTTHIDTLEECCVFEHCITVPDCTPQIGACCINGTCIEMPEEECIASGGVFIGGPCGPCDCGDDAFGACCREDGTCTEMFKCECEQMGGVFLGDGVSCDDAPCGGADVGACCLQGVCQQLTAEECEAVGGMFVGGPCDPCVCPTGEVGACCLPDGGCVQIDECECFLAGGTFLGPIPCDEVQCKPVKDSCPGDCNQDGVIDGADLAALLANWGPCNFCVEDVDHDGVVGAADLGTLLASWGGCP